jgi:hypothetical protein
VRRVKPLLVGEVNPLSDRPEHALYPWPANCSGERLQRLVIGVSRPDYLRAFDRVDLCVGKWSLRAARTRAAELAPGRPLIILLGTKVCSAFGVTYDPFTIIVTSQWSGRFVVLPHPSGLCRHWQVAGAYLRARDVLKRAGVLNDDGSICKFANGQETA